MLGQSDIWAGVSFTEHLSWFAPEMALILTMLAIVAAPIVLGRGARTVGGVATFGVLVTLFLAVRSAGLVSAEPQSGLSPDAASGMLISDNMSAFFKILLAVFLCCVTYLWWVGSMETERDAPEFFILLLGSAFGMALMASTTNLLMMIIAIEAASLPSYAIVGFNKRNAKSAEASLKYMIFGAISAAMMIYGVSLLYGLTGSMEMGPVAYRVVAGMGSQPVLYGAALVCMFAGLAFKISAVPFHFWCPDAFEGAKIEVTTWLSVVSKAAGLILLMRVVMAFCQCSLVGERSMEQLAPLAWGLGIVASITCTWANFAAYRQKNVRRMLAYSSIAHAGYMMMAAGAFIYTSGQGGIETGMPHPAVSALLAYVLIYLFMNLGAFGICALVGWHVGHDDFGAFTGLFRRAWWLALPMFLCLISLVGLPILAGFFGKWWVLVALGEMAGGQSTSLTALGWTLVVVAALNTLFSLYYYMRVVIEMALRDDERLDTVQAPAGGIAMVNLCAIALLAMFFFHAPVKSMVDRYASNLYRTVEVASAESAGDVMAEASE